MKSFLQTKDWAKFQEAYGRRVFWIDDKLVVKFDLPLGKSWLYCPRAELKNIETEKQRNRETEKLKNIKTKNDPPAGGLKTNEGVFFNELAKLATKENAIFVKIEPDSNSKFKFEIFNQIRNSNVPKNDLLLVTGYMLHDSSCLQPQDELVFDITPSEDKLLEQMHQKTRYNIRLAQKKGLIVKKSSDPVKDIDIFYRLAVETSDRNNFKYHSKKYYQKMMEVLKKEKNLPTELLIAYLVDEPVAAIILLYHQNICYYLHGASSQKHKSAMAPYLLQWEGIHRAKKTGCKWYNFGGVTPEGVEDHAWSGITRFKKGFSSQAQVLHYPDAYDIVFEPVLYWVYKTLKKLT